jgi:hypothetical protein
MNIDLYSTPLFVKRVHTERRYTIILVVYYFIFYKNIVFHECAEFFRIVCFYSQYICSFCCPLFLFSFFFFFLLIKNRFIER